MAPDTARRTTLLLFLGLLMAAGCGPSREVPPAASGPLPPRSPQGGFTDVTVAAGVTARHILPTLELRNIVDGVGAGAAFADLDNDGWLDLIVLGGPRSPEPGVPAARHAGIRIYRNLRNGRFEDITARTGIPPDSTGVAVAVADVDGDGLRDIYIVDRGGNRLYRNLGSFRFKDVTKRAGVAGGRFGIGAVFFDPDGRGAPDLFVANYLEYDSKEHSFYAPDAYPGPGVYKPEAGVLYHNRGDGTFTDVSAAAGIAAIMGRGMSVAAFDADEDGRTDLFVANDVTESVLWMNDGKGRFHEAGALAGVAYGEQGERTSSMATDIGDVDADGHQDIVVSDNAYGSLYRWVSPGRFQDVSRRSGMAGLVAQHVSWGANLIDFDNSGALGLFVVQADLHHLNGWEPLLLRNDGTGHFSDASKQGGAVFSKRLVGRCTIVGDYDNDGREDILVTVLGDRPVLLRNDFPDRNSWITLDLIGRKYRDPFGAKVTLAAGGKRYVKECRCRSSYLGQGDLRLHFGLGPGVKTVDKITIRWPDGALKILTGVPARQFLSIRQ